jgi:hypothetical protein
MRAFWGTIGAAWWVSGLGCCSYAGSGVELNFSDSMVDLSEWYDCLGDGLLNGGG